MNKDTLHNQFVHVPCMKQRIPDPSSTNFGKPVVERNEINILKLFENYKIAKTNR